MRTTQVVVAFVLFFQVSSHLKHVWRWNQCCGGGLTPLHPPSYICSDDYLNSLHTCAVCICSWEAYQKPTSEFHAMKPRHMWAVQRGCLFRVKLIMHSLSPDSCSPRHVQSACSEPLKWLAVWPKVCPPEHKVCFEQEPPSQSSLWWGDINVTNT